MFDKNGDQKISGEELYEVMKYLGISATEKEVSAMIQVVDKNSEFHYKIILYFILFNIKILN